MPQVTIDIPTGQTTRVTKALCASAGLTVSPANAKEAIARHIRGVVISYERGQAEQSAMANVIDPTDPGVT